MRRTIHRCLLAAFALACAAHAQEVVHSEKADFKVAPFADGLEHPWSMVQLPDGRFLVTERPGRLRIVENGKLLPEPVKGVPPVYTNGQGGLLDVELHPDYAKSGWIYFSLADPMNGKGTTKIIRARLKGNELVDQQTIFQAPPEDYSGSGVQFGSRIEFDKDGYLFFTIGDRGGPTTPANDAQKITNSIGKTFRLFDDGRIPPDNPFVNTPGACKAIWTYGNRNGQGLRFDKNGTLWETEHGPRGGDELNIIAKGKNYGWPITTYGINYSGTPITDKRTAPGIEAPVTYWVPSPALCGIDFYYGDKFPGWKGSLFISCLAHQKIIRCEIDASNKVTHQEILFEHNGRIRDIYCAPDGAFYVVFDEPGKIVQLVPGNL